MKTKKLKFECPNCKGIKTDEANQDDAESLADRILKYLIVADENILTKIYALNIAQQLIIADLAHKY